MCAIPLVQSSIGAILLVESSMGAIQWVQIRGCNSVLVQFRWVQFRGVQFRKGSISMEPHKISHYWLVGYDFLFTTILIIERKEQFLLLILNYLNKVHILSVDVYI